MNIFKQQKKTSLGLPPWFLIGAVIILFPVFSFVIIDNINYQKQNSIRLLLEKGAALIRSFEAGTRSHMMGMIRVNQLQNLLMETAQQPDILYILVTDSSGRILAHNSIEEIGKRHHLTIGPENPDQIKSEQYRIVENQSGAKIFEVYRKFSPTGKMGRGYGRDASREGLNHLQIAPGKDGTGYLMIFLGLDMEAVEAARKSDTRHSIIMGTVMLFIAVVGVMFLFLAQSYRTTRRSLSTVKAFSENLVDHMPIGLIAINSNGEITSLNHVAERVFSDSSSISIGESAGKLLPEAILEQIEMFKQVPHSVEKEIECDLGEGQILPISITVSALEDERGVFLGYILLFKDLTEMNLLRKEVERNKRLASIGSLAAGIAHEIRNPLSSIKGFATYFKETSFEKEADKNSATVMIQEVERLDRVVGQLLEFARPVTITRKMIHIKPLLEDALTVIKNKDSHGLISIEKRFPSNIPPVKADPDRLIQVFLNLLLNGMDAIEGNGKISVSIYINDIKKGIDILLKDTGKGISKKNQAHIFDPYFTTKSSGTGLGLAISLNIVNAHKGEILVESKEGKGTTFTVFLPWETE